MSANLAFQLQLNQARRMRTQRKKKKSADCNLTRQESTNSISLERLRISLS